MKDVFLSHASIDKEKYARPLFDHLEASGVSTWLDEIEIDWGGSITGKINNGLKQSKFVVVLLSESFIGRNWTESELASSIHRENSEGRIIVLPIIIGDPKKILSEYPLLRDKSYLSWSDGMDRVASELIKLLDKLSVSRNNSLIISDGTEFALGLANSSARSGLNVEVQSISKNLHEDQLSEIDLVVIVLGEHINQHQNKYNFSLLCSYVKYGGSVLCTSWMAWASQIHEELRKMLPFESVEYRFHENKKIDCIPNNVGNGADIFNKEFSLVTSFEILREKEYTTTLLRTANNNPLFGYRRYGTGISYYLNMCQHSCVEPAKSPLRESTELEQSVDRIFYWLSNRAKRPTAEYITSSKKLELIYKEVLDGVGE